MSYTGSLLAKKGGDVLACLELASYYRGVLGYIAPTRMRHCRQKEVAKAMVKINFTAVADSFQPRESGEYQGTLISHKINEASASSGQPTVTLEWSEDDSPNRKMFKTYSLQPKALWSLKRDLVRIGKADPTFIERLNDEDADLDELITSLYGFSNTLVYGEPRTGKDKEGNERQFDNFLEVRDPDKL